MNNRHPKNYIDLTGEKYGRLTVLRRDGTNKHGVPMWRCLCDCGEEVRLSRQDLRSGNTSSCGCLKRDLVTAKNLKHGMAGSRIYRIWYHMKGRCTVETDKAYPRYGGRGIWVCDRWLDSFENFYEDMKEGYRDDLTIDRIDNNDGYYKENCRWATYKQQANNKNNNVKASIDGETKTIAEWCDELGINPDPAYRRKMRGWRDDMLFLPSSTMKYKQRIAVGE